MPVTPWEEFETDDAEKRKYYHNRNTKETVWEMPIPYKRTCSRHYVLPWAHHIDYLMKKEARIKMREYSIGMVAIFYP